MGNNGSQLMSFMMKMMLLYLVNDIDKGMPTLILIVFVLVMLEVR
jgi:hypothetical protein